MITCPRCGRTSHNRVDETEGYCGFCHDFTSPAADARAAARRLEAIHSTLTRGEKLVLLAMCELADRDGYAAPSAAQLAEQAGYHKRQAQNLKHALVDKGLLEPAGYGRCSDIKGVTVRRTPRYRVTTTTVDATAQRGKDHGAETRG